MIHNGAGGAETRFPIAMEHYTKLEICCTAAGIPGNGYCYEDIAMKAQCLKYFSSSLKYFT